MYVGERALRLHGPTDNFVSTVQGYRVSRAPPRALAGFVLVMVTMAASAHAADTPGASALRQARAAWDKGHLEAAESSYRDAIEKGGLGPNDVLEGYVRLGAIRAAMGKKDQAVAAFRAASVLDSGFAVPSEAGPKGPALAEKAKRDTAKIGSIQLAVTAPKEAPSGKPFKVSATLDKAHLPIVNKVGLVAKDGTTGKETTLDADKGESMEFEVPADITLPGASIIVRVDALDGHQNRLASAEERVRVPDSGRAVAAAPARPAERKEKFTAPPNDERRRGGTFFSTPWPYVIGGVALAGAAAAVYFGTRPPADVSVGQVGVRAN